MYADDHREALPALDPLGFGMDEPQYQLSLRVRLSPSQWDGLGILWSNEYLSTGQVFYCPSHTGDHPFSAYAARWGGAEGEIFGNIQYRYRSPSSRLGPVSLYSAPGMAVLCDGLRTRDDFNHRVGSNVMRNDLSVLWYSDPTGQVLATLPASEDEVGAAARVEQAWDKLDSANTEGR